MVLFLSLAVIWLAVLVPPIWRSRDSERQSGPTLQQRIGDLSLALKSTAAVADDILAEVEARRDLVATLEADANRYRDLLSLNRTEVEAIAQTLTGEVRRESIRSTRQQVVINLVQSTVFFGLGVLATIWMR